METPQNYYELRDMCGVVHNAKVYGLADAVRRSKYPMAIDPTQPSSFITPTTRRLATSPAGSAHDHWLCGANVQFDLNFTNKAWVEAERYHWLDIVSSQSTMHRICKMNLGDPGAFSLYTDNRIIAILQELVAEYNAAQQAILDYNTMIDTTPFAERPDGWEKHLADLRESAKHLYLRVLYSVPSGLRLTAGMTTNYLQLKTIYNQRKDHRLPEWREFCYWIESLPLSELITGKETDAPCE